MSNKSTNIEQAGVDLVPREQRTVGFRDLFMIWAGFSIIMTNFLLGALGVGAGIATATVAHIIGILYIAAVVWLGTKMGSDHGVAGTVAMRSAFGINGRHISSIIMFVVGVGWFGVQTGMVGSAAHEIMKELAPALAFTDEVWMVITGILMASVAIWGYGAIVWLNRIAMPGLIILLIVLIYKVFVEFGDKLSAFEPSGDISFLAVIGLLPSGMAAALILGADYGRYVRPEGKASWAAPISVIIFFALLAFMGLVSSAVAGTWDPVQIFVDLGLGVFGLLMLILAAWTTNVSNIYVASLALSNMTKLSRQNTSIIATVIGIILALIGIYSLSGLQTWLSWITALLIPTSGVLLVDYYILNKQRLLTGELFKEKDSAYWYTGGWNLRAVIAWAFGAVLTFILPSTWIPAVTTLIATGIVYYLLSMNTQGIALKISNETTIGK